MWLRALHSLEQFSVLKDGKVTLLPLILFIFKFLITLAEKVYYPKDITYNMHMTLKAT